MPIAFSLLLALLATTPAMVTVAGPSAWSLTYLMVAGIAASSAAAASSSEFAGAVQILRRFALAMLIPGTWMIVQIIPLPIPSLGNPIWATAAIALNETPTSRISLDPSSTLSSLFWYLALLLLAISAYLLTKDRKQAETALLVLTAVTTLMALESLFDRLGWLDLLRMEGRNDGAIAIAALLGTLTNGAMITMAIERHLSRSETPLFGSSPLLLRLAASICGIALSMAAILTGADVGALAAAALGVGVLIFVPAARSLGLRPWMTSILAAILLASGAFLSLALLYSAPTLDLLGLARSASPQALTVSQRALANSSWIGSGVGTFDRLAQVYREFGAGGPIAAPSTAISIAIEWGRPALLILAAFALQLIFFAIRGAVSRGRDSFFPTLAVAALVSALCSSFLNPGLQTPAIQIILAVTIGLGLSQSTGRSREI